MLTHLEMAKAFQISRTRVTQLVKEGMPLTSIAAAKKWRNKRGDKRAPTNSISAANLQPNEIHAKRKLKARKPSKTGDSLLDALNNSIVVADAAFEDFHFARLNNLPTRSVRLSEHSKAIEARLKSERAYREESERREVLVNKQVIMDKCRHCLETVLRLIKKLPSENAAQANPHDQILLLTRFWRRGLHTSKRASLIGLRTTWSCRLARSPVIRATFTQGDAGERFAFRNADGPPCARAAERPRFLPIPGPRFSIQSAGLRIAALVRLEKRECPSG
jgi:hypothetical protein